MSNFVPLHVVTGYSFLSSGLTIKRIEKSLKEQDYFAIGICDESVLYGFPEFAHMMADNKKPYVLGMSVIIDDHYLCLFANSEIGYRHLIEINRHIQLEDLSLSSFDELGTGLVGILKTNVGFFKDNLSHDVSFTKVIAVISNYFDNFYLGLDIKSKEEMEYAKVVREFANKFTYNTIAIPRIAYQKKNDAIILRIVDAIKNGDTLEIKKEDGQEYFMKGIDYQKIYTPKEIAATKEVAEMCQFDFLTKRGEILHYPVENSTEYLKDTTCKKLKELSLDNNSKYVDRLNYELSVISSMGYSDYFLLVQDYVNWAKNHEILVGPGRGSAAGSLVSYLLNITEVDPLKYDLLFERFLNPDRKTMPDIDVDFMDNRRNEVIEYLKDKFGHENVGNIIAFQTIKAKQAIRDIASVYNIPERHVVLLNKHLRQKDLTLGQYYKTVPEFKTLVDSDNYFKEIISLAGKIEGLPRQSGQHAAGVIINQSSIVNSLPVLFDFNGDIICGYESKYLEEQNYLKMDILGLRNLATISYCVDLINQNYPDVHLDKTNIPYNEKEIFDLINTKQTIGLFQIETMAMKKGIGVLKPSNFDDVVALLALNRPGPMEFMSSFALRRDKKEPYSFISEDLKKILGPTYGIIVYQEQVNQIATSMAGFTPSEADTFRKAISKKDKAIIDANKVSFIEGAIKNGYSQKVAEQVFAQIERFASYGFNKSHSVVYAILACRMAYLKAHYPLEFYIALLETGTNETKFSDYVIEMKKRGLILYNPSVNESALTFVKKDDGLIFPLNSISGLRGEIAENIIKEREENGPYKDFFDFVLRLYNKGISDSNLEKLIDAGALDSLYNSRSTLRANSRNALQYAQINYRDDGQLTIGIPLLDKPRMYVVEDNLLENLDKENQALGVMLSGNPLSYYQDVLKEKGVISIEKALDNKISLIAGVSKDIKIIKTKKGSQMAFLRLFDSTGEIDLTLFSDIYEKEKTIISKNKIYIVKCQKEEKNGNISYIAQSIELLEASKNA